MLSEIVAEIKSTTKSIEELNSRMRTLEQGETDQVSRQISQQVSFFPMFLSQQIKMIADLEKQFGEEFQSKCLDEVKEIAETAKNVQATTESALTCVQSSESSKQIECADALFKGTSRLNILQQRITAKMMRCKKQSG